MKYKLIGTIHHNGTFQYRHYYSRIKIDNYWYELNDSHFTKIADLDYGLMFVFYFTKN